MLQTLICCQSHSNCFSFIKDYQTLIGAGIAAALVVWGWFKQGALNRLQAAEGTIIKQIEFHYTILDGIEVYDKEEEAEIRGKAAFDYLYRELEKFYDPRPENFSKDIDQVEDRITISFDKLYTEYGNQFGNYFKNLYLLIDHIDQITLEGFDKTYYIELVKAQLSKYEILLLAYDCIWIRWDKLKGKKFIDYAKKYKLLSSLETNELIKDAITLERLMNERYAIFFPKPNEQAKKQ
jgi:hypothetical protein